MVAAHCGLALYKTRRGAVSSAVHVSSALQLICQRPADIGLLGSATTSHTLSLIFREFTVRDEQFFGLRKDMMEAIIRLEEIETHKNAVEAVARKTLRETLHRFLQSEGKQRRTSEVSLDAGYGSMSDEATTP